MATYRIYLTAIVMILLTSQLCSQQGDVTARLRLAQSFEQSGDWARAAALYESMLTDNPQNYVVFEGLRRSYTELKEYSKAITLVNTRLLIDPGNESLLTTLGGLYNLSGMPQTADSLWQIVLRKDTKNSSLYRIVAAQLIEHRQYDRAIQIYLQGRSATGDMNLFVEELASLYSALRQYENATRELVKIVRLNPQQGTYVQSRLASFTSREEGRQAALGIIENEVKQNPKTIPLRTILAWLMTEGKDYGGALGQYEIIDDVTKAEGKEIFQFAQRAAQERAHQTAAKAFREVVGRTSAPTMLAQARLGYARAIEELSIENDSTAQAQDLAGSPKGDSYLSGTISETQPTLRGALALYENIVADYPRSEVAMQATFRMGRIFLSRFFDLDGAAAAFTTVKSMGFNASLQNEAILSLAEVETARNRLDQARQQYILFFNLPLEHERERALFRIAELDYFEANFDSATARLERISTNTKGDQANDALQLLYFIQENRGSGTAALKEFSRAELLVRQRKHSEALVVFEGLAALYPGSPLLDDCMLRSAELQLHLGRVPGALATFQRIVTEMKTSVLRDRAQMRIGEVYERTVKNKVNAIEAYEKLLEQFPTSLFAEEARKRIRILRGDARSG